MAVSVRASSSLTAMPELQLPSSLSCIASEIFAVKFPSTNSRSSLKLQLSSAKNNSRLSAVSPNGIWAIATGVQEVPPPSYFYFSPSFGFRWNKKELQDKIQLVPIDLKDRRAWYKEKVYQANKVTGEILDLIKYVDRKFEVPSLFPDNPDRREFVDELLSYTDTFYKKVTFSFKKDDATEAGVALDYIENALSKYDCKPFFLGQFSLVDITYAPFIERFQAFLLDVKNYDISVG